MTIVIWGVVGIFIIAAIKIIFFQKKAPLATAQIKADEGRVAVTLSGVSGADTAIPMALCYAAKIWWLALSEGDQTRTILRNLFSSTLSDWPDVPKVDMMSTLSQTPIVFSVNLIYGPKYSGWFVINDVPNLVYSVDLATHLFILISEIVRNLSDADRIKLGQSLRLLFEVLSQPEAQEQGFGGLKFVNGEANRIIASVNEGVL